MESNPVAIELNVDAALVLQTLVGIEAYPLVLAVVPNIADWDDVERVYRAVLAELVQSGIVSPDGEVHPQVAEWLRCLYRPDVELAVRVVQAGSGDGALAVLRMSLVRCADRHVLAVRNDDRLVIQSVYSAPGRLSTLSAAVLAGMGKCPPALFEPWTAPVELTADVITAVADDRRRIWRELGADATCARILTEAAVIQAAEIVAYEYHDGRIGNPENCVKILDTAEGRLVVSPRSSAAGGHWLHYSPGDTAAVHRAIASLIEMLPAGNWFETSRV